ncbi:hypothetical protein ASPZODRAFT_131949 [Penicilliopsis zonata CBS 506.65]|uniref:Uncharacterized protein n=1 Tax=Penicilliopsis zonata CBS 506.65 TaxID=1073090 RepID=A0A1L9SII3_9EURO|nr:hypothetical protein ASPZODRAFT_131949 [Penicilliopsis zonata CBS 506.65]OJJ47025.1 hypothetical protein ASPZODRAFT_131949 [Penicilliopsis zonata CBS 506.65]
MSDLPSRLKTQTETDPVHPPSTQPPSVWKPALDRRQSWNTQDLKHEMQERLLGGSRDSGSDSGGGSGSGSQGFTEKRG